MAGTETLFILLTTFLLGACLLFLEFRRYPKSQLFIRLLATSLLVFGILGLFVHPSFPWKEGPKGTLNTQNLFILTEGFTTRDLSKLRDPVFYTFDPIIKKALPGVRIIKNQAFADSSFGRGKNLEILGFGLSENELENLGNRPFIYHPPPPPLGIISCNWNRFLGLGQTLSVQGKVYNPSRKPLKLSLEGLGIQVDSFRVPSKKWSNFQMETVPKIPGQNVFKILLIDQKDTLEKEPLPFLVQKSAPLEISFLSSSPEFETKFLMNWIQKKGDILKSRTIISKSKIQSVQNDSSKSGSELLSASSLKNSDVLFTEHTALDELDSRQLEEIRKAVELGGLGLVIRIDTLSKQSSWYDRGFSLDKNKMNQPISEPLALRSSPKPTEPLNLGSYYLAARSGQQSLLQSEDKRIQAGLRLFGKGKIMWTTLDKTYQWVLKGDSVQYNQVWTALLNAVVRKTIHFEFSRVENQIPHPNQSLILQTLKSSVPKIKVPFLHSPVLQNEQIPFLWSQNIWPENTGWQITPRSAESSSGIFIYPSGDWKNLDRMKKISLTREKGNQNLLDSFNYTGNTEEKRTTIPPLYFYLLIIGALSYLWIENKIQEL